MAKASEFQKAVHEAILKKYDCTECALLPKSFTSRVPNKEDLADYRPPATSADRDWERFDGDH